MDASSASSSRRKFRPIPNLRTAVVLGGTYRGDAQTVRRIRGSVLRRIGVGGPAMRWASAAASGQGGPSAAGRPRRPRAAAGLPFL